MPLRKPSTGRSPQRRNQFKTFMSWVSENPFNMIFKRMRWLRTVRIDESKVKVLAYFGRVGLTYHIPVENKNVERVKNEIRKFKSETSGITNRNEFMTKLDLFWRKIWGRYSAELKDERF